MTRLGREIRACAWTPDGKGLLLGTSAGLHRFDLRLPTG
jgi:hypothetical protein